MSSRLVWPAKDPDEVLDYLLDWSAVPLENGETISESTWESDVSGIAIGSSSIVDCSTVVWLSGGVAGTSYKLTNHIVTSEAREYDQSVTIRVKDL